MVDKFRYAQSLLLEKIAAADGIRYSQLDKREQKLADYLAKTGKVSFEPIHNDWIVR